MKITNYKLLTILITFFVILLSMLLFAQVFKLFFAGILIIYCVVLFYTFKTAVISLTIDESSFRNIIKFNIRKFNYGFASVKTITITNTVKFTEYTFFIEFDDNNLISFAIDDIMNEKVENMLFSVLNNNAKIKLSCLDNMYVYNRYFYTKFKFTRNGLSLRESET